MATDLDYAVPGSLTTLDAISAALLEPLGADPAAICFPIHSLFIEASDAEPLGLPPERFATSQIRPAAALVAELLALDPSPLNVAREPANRVVGTYRHFAVLSCALLRHQGIPARVRCGFATYFQPNQGLDHWIIEYRDDNVGRWVRIDSEILGQTVLTHPEDLEPGQFLTGGEAWTAFRKGEIDAATFGVYGTDNWGAAEIRGNTVKDLAALNEIETLPWDEWGRMTEAYEGTTGPDYDELLDTVAAVCAEDDPTAIAALYERDEFRVPLDLIR
jgi:hypothetical protein